MTLEHILGGKGRDVFRIGPTASLAEAASLLAEKKIGAVLVMDDDHALQGILSERDIVRAIASGGAAVMQESVAHHMTAKVVSCSPTSSIAEVMELMTKGKFRHVPVMEAGRLEGLVSIGDIVKQRLADMEAEHLALRDYIAGA